MTLWQDVRFALRGMVKARAVTAVALVTLAVGIGANTAIFSIVNAVLLRPLPFRNPGQLVQIFADLPGVEHPERFGFWGVARSYFELLGARPQLGRLFDNRDTADGFADAVVISDGLWRRIFGGDPAIIGAKD